MLMTAVPFGMAVFLLIWKVGRIGSEVGIFEWKLGIFPFDLGISGRLARICSEAARISSGLARIHPKVAHIHPKAARKLKKESSPLAALPFSFTFYACCNLHSQIFAVLDAGADADAVK